MEELPRDDHRIRPCRPGGGHQPVSDQFPKSVMPPASPKDMRRISRRSFAWAGVGLASMFGIGHWIFTRRQDGGVPWPLRRVLDLNENVWTDFFSSKRTAPHYDQSKI